MLLFLFSTSFTKLDVMVKFLANFDAIYHISVSIVYHHVFLRVLNGLIAWKCPGCSSLDLSLFLNTSLRGSAHWNHLQKGPFEITITHYRSFKLYLKLVQSHIFQFITHKQ